jgi:DNA-binding NarL/FixJ family response regulator
MMEPRQTGRGHDHVGRQFVFAKDAYLLFGCATEKLAYAVRALARGSRCLDDAVNDRIASSLVHSALTSRERDVLNLVVQGAGNKHIARALDLADQRALQP